MDFTKRFNTHYLDDKNNTVIVIGLNHGEICKKDLTLNYTVTMKLTCDPNGTKQNITWNDISLNSFDPESCNNTIEATSYEGINELIKLVPKPIFMFC